MAGERFILFDTSVDAMFTPGGEVDDFMRGKANDTVRFARIILASAGKNRSYRLSNSIRYTREARASRSDCGYIVRADAPHASYVHEGTYGPIVGVDGPMSVPRWPRTTRPRVLRDEVAGQDAFPFLTMAMEAAGIP